MGVGGKLMGVRIRLTSKSYLFLPVLMVQACVPSHPWKAKTGRA